MSQCCCHVLSCHSTLNHTPRATAYPQAATTRRATTDLTPRAQPSRMCAAQSRTRLKWSPAATGRSRCAAAGRAASLPLARLLLGSWACPSAAAPCPHMYTGRAVGTANPTRCTLHLRSPLAQKGIPDSSCNPPSPSPSPSPDIDTSRSSSTTNNPSLASDCSAVKPRNLDQCCAVSLVQ